MRDVNKFAYVVAGVGLGVAVGFVLVSRSELGSRLSDLMKITVLTSKKKIEEVSEEAAIRTARITRNPKVNQDWVARQWESVGY